MDRRERARRLRRLLTAGAVCVLAGPAAAQLGGLGGRIGGQLGGVLQAPGRLAAGAEQALDPDSLLSLRLDRLDALVRGHPHELDRDTRGEPVVRDEVLAVDPAEPALARALGAGFKVLSHDDVGDLRLVVLATPHGVSAREGVKRLRRLDPAGSYDFNHLYVQSGTVQPSAAPDPANRASARQSVRVGLIDGGIDTHSPVFAGVRVHQQSFAGKGSPSAHGTAVASLLVGEAPPFAGSAPGAELFAADVYGGAPTGGSADAIVRAIGWLLTSQARVINISLVGPPNAALQAAVKLAQRRGVAVVAAVGNDGPAAPPSYPASYPGVVAVTGVDAHGRVLLEAGRAEHLDFAAPGADMAAAARGGGYVAVRGTSFAAPLAAGRLAILLGRGRSLPEAEEALAHEGRPGRGYGRALVAERLRTSPDKVRAVGELRLD